jgi:plasmid stabilization system protein ParE
VTNVRVRFHSEARAEAEAAVRWYEERLSGLGSDLLVEVERAVTLIAQAPMAWPVTPDDPRARRFLLSRFPYSLVYIVQPAGDVVVAAVMHARRQPGYWRKRLSRSR